MTKDAPLKKEYATLRRRPFLTPIWLAAIAALIVASFIVWLWGTATSTTVVVIRHAEKQLNAGDDPPLSAEGQARAGMLARMLGARAAVGRVEAIYVSPTRRSRETAAPLAAQLQLSATLAARDDPKSLVRRVLREHQGGVVLIVAHADTIPAIVQLLSGAGPIAPIADAEYGTVYVVTVPRIGHASVLRLNY